MANIERTDYPENDAYRWWVSYADCVAGTDVFSFPLTVANTSNTIEVWAGNEDCAGKRGNVDRGQCRLLQTASPGGRDSLRVQVPVRNIVGAPTNTTDVPDEGFEADVCDRSTDPAGTKFTFYILQVNNGTTTASTTWNGGTGGTGYDMIGPAAPTSIAVSIGENQLIVGVGGVNPDPDRDRFALYCVDLGVPDEENFESVPGAGSRVICPTPELVAGERPAPGRRQCGSAGETSQNIATSGELVNDHLYAVAVAAQDNLGNAGPLTDLACGIPRELQDFFEIYVQNGGAAGGGFCGLRPGKASSAPSAMLLGILLVALRARRGRSTA